MRLLFGKTYRRMKAAKLSAAARHRGTEGSNPFTSTGESGELPITSEGSAGSAVTGTDRRKPLQLWRGSQKVADETCYCCRILEVRRMTGARDDMDPRAGEALRELVRVY